MIEATDPTAAFDAATALATELGAGQAGSVYVFRTLWRLGRDIARAPG